MTMREEMSECDRDMLRLGSRGSQVEVLHQLLVEQGFDPGEDEWSDPRTFGSETEDAVRQFQAAHSGRNQHPLVVDGVVGANTWWSLEHPSGSYQDPPRGLVPRSRPLNVVAEAALAAALREHELGVREEPDGSNRGSRVDLYTGMAGKGYAPDFRGPPWCAYFVSWCFFHAPGGSPFGRQGSAQSIVHYCSKHVPKSVYPDELTAALRSNRLGTRDLENVRDGDVGVIVTGPGKGHATIVLSVDRSAGVVWTVEGNSGNAVRVRRRSVSQFSWFVNFDDYAARLTTSGAAKNKS